jgi:hypothetical protein
MVCWVIPSLSEPFAATAATLARLVLPITCHPSGFSGQGATFFVRAVL